MESTPIKSPQKSTDLNKELNEFDYSIGFSEKTIKSITAIQSLLKPIKLKPNAVPLESPIRPSSSNVAGYYCKICDKRYLKIEAFRKHKISKKHQEEERRSKGSGKNLFKKNKSDDQPKLQINYDQTNNKKLDDSGIGLDKLVKETIDQDQLLDQMNSINQQLIKLYLKCSSDNQKRRFQNLLNKIDSEINKEFCE